MKTSKKLKSVNQDHMIPYTKLFRDTFSRCAPIADPWAIINVPEQNYVMGLIFIGRDTCY